MKLHGSVLCQEMPKEFQDGVFIADSILYAKDYWKGQVELQSFVGLAKRKYGIKGIEFLPDKQFKEKVIVYQNEKEFSDSDEAHESEIIQYAATLIWQANDAKATDIHLCSFGTHGTIQFRCNGLLKVHSTLPGKRIHSLISVIYGSMTNEKTETSFTTKKRLSGRITDKKYFPGNVESIRVQTVPLATIHAESGTGCNMQLRLLYERKEITGTLSERLIALGVPDHARNVIEASSLRLGMKIISGQVNSGKSTTLKHVMEALARDYPQKAYYALEDPPEYGMLGVRQIPLLTSEKAVSEAQKKKHFEEGISDLLRVDPNILMIGEIRYGETAAAAIIAAQTGHPLWTTLHAPNAFGIIPRLVTLLNQVNFVDPMEFLCDPTILSCLIYQRLVSVLCPNCKQLLKDADEDYKNKMLPHAVYQRLQKTLSDGLDTVCIQGEGCDTCQGTGFVDQRLVMEAIDTDLMFLRNLRTKGLSEMYQEWLSDPETVTFQDDAIAKIQEGLFDPRTTEEQIGRPLSLDRTYTT